VARLINPGTGEILDRLSILSLKILHAGLLAGRDVDHFRNERNALLVTLRGKNGFAAWFDEYQQIGAVNAALWYAEDELRDWRLKVNSGDVYKETDRAVRVCAFRIQALNDERARLIHAINTKTGEQYGQEKLT
jgi:hypothetical protein